MGTIEAVETIFQNEDFCANCAQERREKQLPPNLKITLPERTSHIGLVVKICPECDGLPPAIEDSPIVFEEDDPFD